MSSSTEQIKEIFQGYGVSLQITDEMFEKFSRFHRFLVEYNKKYNLTRLTRFEDIIVKHFIDCVMVAQLTELPSVLMDLGSGAGFPGVPLKIVSPKMRVILAEGVQKKVEFLKQLREELGLSGLDILGKNIDSKTHYPVQGVITRAVEPALNTLRNVINCVQKNGYVLLMKTPETDDEVRGACFEMKQSFELIQDVAYQLGSSSHHRRLVVFRKL
jgi:16S rRNA (guanine(527)-N(7))-methyltransferase RsmG